MRPALICRLNSLAISSSSEAIDLAIQASLNSYGQGHLLFYRFHTDYVSTRRPFAAALPLCRNPRSIHWLTERPSFELTSSLCRKADQTLRIVLGLWRRRHFSMCQNGGLGCFHIFIVSLWVAERVRLHLQPASLIRSVSWETALIVEENPEICASLRSSKLNRKARQNHCLPFAAYEVQWRVTDATSSSLLRRSVIVSWYLALSSHPIQYEVNVAWLV